MKKRILLILCLFYSVALFSQEKMFIHKSDKITLGAPILLTDSVYFDSEGTNAYFKIGDYTAQYAVSNIDSISFGENSSTIYVTYDGTSVSVINPLAFEGVTVSVSGADVTVVSTSEEQEINYCLKGTTSDGMFKLYSNYRYNLIMNGVKITNADGPAINIQSGKKGVVNLIEGTTNSLSDGSPYASSSEDQKSTFFSEGQLQFEGSGSLTVKSKAKHAIASDDYINILNGTITISGAGKDGIHANDYFKMSGGTLNVTSLGDGIECEGGYVLISGGSITTTNTVADTKGITSDSTLTISGGTINMTVSGNQSKGLKSSKHMTLSGGSITINTSGAAVLESSGTGYNPSYCTAIKCDSAIYITGATIAITSTGVGGKGISSDSNIDIASGNVTINTSGAGATYTNATGNLDSYASSCLDADGDIQILGGSITASSSGIGGKGVSTNGNLTIGDTNNSPTLNVSTTGTQLLISGTVGTATAVYADPKAIKTDGAVLVNNGTITVSTTQPGASGFDNDSTFTVTGGAINITIAGSATKGINTTRTTTLSGGTLTINTSGNVGLKSSGSGYETSYCSGIKSTGDVIINGASVTITSTGIAGKGITSDANIEITNGTVSITSSGNGATFVNTAGTTDSYSATNISANGNINIIGGSVTSTSTGISGKGISADGNLTFGTSTSSPIVNVSTTGVRLLVSGTAGYATAVYSESKAIKSDGALNVNNGTLTVSTTQPSADAIDCDSTLTIVGGTIGITIAGNQTKGLKSTKNMNLNGGAITIISKGGVVLETSGSGYDPAYCKAIACNGAIAVNGSSIIITSTGIAGKGISADGSISMASGSINITTSGVGATYKNSSATTDSYSASCISSDGAVSILGGSVTLASSGLGGKGISAEGILTLGETSSIPTIGVTTTGAKFLVSGTDYCHPKAIRCTGAIIINNGAITIASSDDAMHSETSITQNNGTVTITTSVEGVESKFVTINGGSISVTASDDGFNTTYSTVSGGTEQNDGSCLTINGGFVTASSTNGDAIDSNGNIVMNGGTVVVHGPPTQPNEGVDFNGSFSVTGGFLIAAGPSNSMNKPMSSCTNQNGIYISTSTGIAANTIINIQNATGSLVTFKPVRAAYYFLFSSSSLVSGTYTIWTGGTSTGTNTNGLITGGTYSGGIQKKSFTLSGNSGVTSVSF